MGNASALCNVRVLMIETVHGRIMARALASLAALALAIALLMAPATVRAQPEAQPSAVHLRVEAVPAIAADGVLMEVSGFVVLQRHPGAGPVPPVARSEVRTRLEQALVEAVAGLAPGGSAADLDAATALVGDRLAAAVDGLDASVVAHGISALLPGDALEARLAERARAAAERDRLQVAAEIEAIAGMASAEAASLNAATLGEVRAEEARAADAVHEIMTAAVGGDGALYRFWAGRRLAAEGFATTLDGSDNPFDALDRLMASCLAPLDAAGAAGAGSGSGTAVPEAGEGDRSSLGWPSVPAVAELADATAAAKTPTRDGPKQQQRPGGGGSRVTVTVTGLTADGMLVDLVLTVGYEPPAGPALPLRVEQEETERLLSDLVSAAALIPLRRTTARDAAEPGASPIAEDVLARVADDLAALDTGLAVRSVEASAAMPSARLGVEAFDPAVAASELEAAEAEARLALEAAALEAERRVETARLATEAAIARAEAEVAAFAAFRDRYEQAPGLVADRFCLSLIAGKADGG